MNECEKFEDLISAYIDGEVTSEERDELMAHIENCPHCAELLAIYTDISLIASEDVEPPEELLAGVMAEVHKINAKNAAPAKKAKVIYLRWAAIAACAALVIFAGTRFIPGTSFDTASGGAANTSTGFASSTTGGGVVTADSDGAVYNYSAETDSAMVASEKSESAADSAYDTATPEAPTAAEPEAADNGFADLTGNTRDSENGTAIVETCATAEDLAASHSCFAIVIVHSEDLAAIGTIEDLSHDGTIWAVCDGYDATLISEDTFNSLAQNDSMNIRMLENGSGSTALLAVIP